MLKMLLKGISSSSIFSVAVPFLHLKIYISLVVDSPMTLISIYYSSSLSSYFHPIYISSPIIIRFYSFSPFFYLSHSPTSFTFLGYSEVIEHAINAIIFSF